MPADFREDLFKNRKFPENRKTINYFFNYFLNKKYLIMLVNPFCTIYVPIEEENLGKMRILWFFDVFRVSKKRHFRPKSSILTTFCLPDKKVFGNKFSTEALSFSKIK